MVPLPVPDGPESTKIMGSTGYLSGTSDNQNTSFLTKQTRNCLVHGFEEATTLVVAESADSTSVGDTDFVEETAGLDLAQTWK
jgi:hypothetical protein